MKRYVWIAVITVFFLMLVGCGTPQIQENGTRPVDFTVVERQQVPEALMEIIEEHKKQEIRMTYADGDMLYLVRGYGEQKTGGYSIAVRSCTENEEKLWLDTQLLGPQKEAVSADPSYPCLIICLEKREKAVMID